MKLTLPLAAAALVFAVSASADEPAQETAPSVTETQVEQQESDPAEEPAQATQAEAAAPEAPQVDEEPEEAERICRRVRLDAASRRPTRVCMTKAEWRRFNSGN
ncbi:hypothetical protein NAP1_04855 [Erythrobacter sp. NAP1]|uniref:hypothetical protein n=1 Tax=Erythrobacter sp. NAP1 TaxID=237727 RepID=UPI0000686964|nr:hypothetical protein [Erythrobacter sp. NAP1]EAQ30077.1 hypothetical protein NAP1_04855 [Erythrobacter sp. NAP1]